MHRNGVDLIIGSHPHVVQPHDIRDDGKITLYSLGNFVSNQRTRYRDGGLVATIDVTVVEQGCGKKLLNRLVDYDLNVTPVWVLLPGYEIIPSDVGGPESHCAVSGSIASPGSSVEQGRAGHGLAEDYDVGKLSAAEPSVLLHKRFLQESQ